MLRCIVTSCLLLLGLFVRAQVKVGSFYYVPGKTEHTTESLKDLDSFEVLTNSKYVQVIEINGFASLTDRKKAKKLVSARIDSFINKFDLQIHDININNFGHKKEYVTFEVQNWDRIDIYYFTDDFGLTIKEEPVTNPKPKDTVTKKPPIIKPDKEKVDRDKVTFGTPQVIPIEFKGGTNKVLKESLHYLDALVDTMKNNTFLTAHIRGHVCCGNNERISKKRAKAVYKYLVKNGVEAHRLSYKGYSNTLPLVFPERTQADRAKNRRVDIIFDNGSNVIFDE